MSSGAFDDRRSLAQHGVAIVPPTPIAAPTTGDAAKDGLIAQVRQRTGMNFQFTTMCLDNNGWNLETAMKNYEEIKSTIPQEAYQ